MQGKEWAGAKKGVKWGLGGALIAGCAVMIPTRSWVVAGFGATIGGIIAAPIGYQRGADSHQRCCQDKAQTEYDDCMKNKGCRMPRK